MNELFHFFFLKKEKPRIEVHHILRSLNVGSEFKPDEQTDAPVSTGRAKPDTSGHRWLLCPPSPFFSQATLSLGVEAGMHGSLIRQKRKGS